MHTAAIVRHHARAGVQQPAFAVAQATADEAGARVGNIERMGIPFQKGNPQFKAALNKALADAAADGSLKKVSQKWFGADVSRPAP